MATRSTNSPRSNSARAAHILRKARQLAAKVESWADFSNALFDPEHGLVAQTFPKPRERQQFFKTEEYAAIDRLLSELMNRFGVAAGATPKASTKFVLRLPRTLRLALEREAAEEDVSVHQLALTKLAIPLASRMKGNGSGSV